MYEPGDDIYISVPANSEYACVQLIFKDGAKSAVQKILRKKGE